MIKFNEKYNAEEFLIFLRDFLPVDFVEKEEDIIIKKERYKVINKAKILGFCKSLDLYVLEMDHAKEKDPRVVITTDAFKILADHWIHRALIVFKNNDSENYRFSYLTISLDLNDRNKAVKKYSNARRYSFYLGVDAKVRTPEQQLIKKDRIQGIDDLLNRFSVEVVNKQFYLEVAKYFDELVLSEDKNLLLPSVSQEDVNFRKSFAVRLIGRLMFCWFLKQKKSPSGQLIPDDLLSSEVAKKTKNYYHSILEPLFFEVLNTNIESRGIRNELFDKVPYLNGGLFNPQADDFYELDRGTFSSKFINTLSISDKWFMDFFELLEMYNFTIDENTVFDQELSVDPEMLGRIFENLLAEINPETGNSERKRTGSFYTPRQIVEYMVDQSLIEYFKTKTGIKLNKLVALVSYDLNDDVNYPLTEEEKQSIIIAIESLKIFDPACGSGAYPIGALQKIVYILQLVDPDCKLWLNEKLKGVPELYKQKIINEVQSNPFDYTRKLDVIKNSIFGVDIQPIAVDVSRLRCFLTLVVESEIDDAKLNRGIEPLPNLDFKFVCANTLISLPKLKSNGLFEDHSGITELSAIMSEYFSCNSQRKNEIKVKFANTQKNILNRTVSHFGRSTGELTLKLISWDPFSNNSNSWFDPSWMFGIETGFDIIIANPPYVDSEIMVKEQPELRQLYSEIYSTAKGNWDLYIPFLEFGYNHLSSDGVSSFITPNKWYAIGYGKEIRKKLVSKIIRIGNCNSVKVFEAGNSPVVTIFKKDNEDADISIDKFDDVYRIVDEVRISNEILADNLGISLADHLPNVIKIRKQDKIINDYFSVQNPCSVSEAYEIKKILEDSPNFDDQVRKSFFLFVNTGTIDPFVSLWGTKDTTYLKDKYQHPVINKDKFKELFPRRFEQVCKPKLIISGMRHFESFFDEEGSFIAGKSTEILISKSGLNLKIALAILNSRLIRFYIKQTYSVLGIDGGINFTTNLIEDLPVPNLDVLDRQESLIKLIDQILVIKNNDVNSDTNELESQLDQIVYRLYNLTPEEIKIIENSPKS